MTRSNKKDSICETRLKNGLTFIHLYTPKDPISAGHLFLPGGSCLEPDAQAGLSALRWALLLKGSTKRTSRQLAEDIESMGASIGGGVTHDYSEVSCHSVSSYFLPTLKIMSEVLFEPAFKEEEIQKEKSALLAAIRSKKESIFSTASEELNKHLFSPHPYSRPSLGNETSVSALHRENLIAWQTDHMQPAQAILVVASDIPFKKIQKEIIAIFGEKSWPQKPKSKNKKESKKIPAIQPKHVHLKKHFEQAFLMMGFPANGISSKNYIALKLINACLGGGMSTRLFQELREKRGLAYDVGSFYPSKLEGSAFVVYMGLQAARMKEAREKIQEILMDFQTAGISENELEFVKNYVKGSFLMDHQTNSQRAHYLGWWRILGKSPSYDRDYPKQLSRISRKQIQKVAHTLFQQKPIIVEIEPQKTPQPSIA